MKVLYIGDIMGEPGIRVVRRVLPTLKKTLNIDLTIAQAENTTEGRGISKADFKTLLDLGIDFCTGGNWTLFRPEIYEQLEDPLASIIRPVNLSNDMRGLGAKYVQTSHGSVLVVSLLGQVVGKDADKILQNPLKSIDAVLEANKDTPKIATIVNFHGDYSSEKVIIGYYLDGRVSAVIGDHWHVPTADARILPNRTAHMSDVGMCGALHSSLGIKLAVTIPRWRDGIRNKNELETEGPLQFNAALVVIDINSGLAKSIKHIQKIVES